MDNKVDNLRLSYERSGMMCAFLLTEVLVLLLSCLQLTPIHADDQSGWMQYRGPDGAGRYRSSEPLPASLDFDSNLKWKTEIPLGHSSPIVVNDSIILSGFEPGKLSTLCFELDTGKLRWRRDLVVKTFEKTHAQHGPATPTPVSDGERVFVAFGSFGVIAYDLKGTELWRDERSLHRNMFGSASSPIIADDKLIVFTGNQDESLLEALEPKTGAVPQVLDGLIITTSYNMRLNQEVIGLPSFEELLKQCDSNGDGMIDGEESRTNKSILSRPDADGQGDHPLRMFVRMINTNKDGQIQADEYPRLKAWVDSFEHANGFIALRPGTLNSVPELVWKHEVGVPECPSPIVDDGKLFAVRNGGVVTCLEIETGKRLFQKRIASGGPYYAALVIGDQKIYLASERGHLTILSANEQPNVLATADLGESIHATPVLASGHLIVRSQNHLWMFGKSAIQN